MPTVAVTDQEFDQKVLKSQVPVLIDFWANWCGPCRLAEPVLEELAQAYGDKVMIVKLDVDANPQTPRNYGVMSIPTTILFRNGKEAGRQIGFAGKGPFEDLIKKAITPA